MALMSEARAVAVDVWNHAAEMTRVAGTLLVDGLFLVGVVLFNAWISSKVDGLKLQGADQLVLEGLRWLLAFCTLGLVVIRLLADLAVALVRTWKSVMQGLAE